MDKRPIVVNWSGGRISLGELKRGTIVDIYDSGGKSCRLVVINQGSQWFLLMEIDKHCQDYMPVAGVSLSSEGREGLIELCIGKPVALKHFEQRRTENLASIREVHLHPEEIEALPCFLEWADDHTPMMVDESKLSPEMLRRVEEGRKLLAEMA